MIDMRKRDGLLNLLQRTQADPMQYDLHHGDCLDIMPTLLPGSVDMVLSDPPYGTTACKWDAVLPFDSMWISIKHVAKRNAAIVMTASQPFTSALVMSNIDWFKYCWVWDKVRAVGCHVSKIRPLQRTEDITVFGEGRITYNPQMVPRKTPRVGGKEYKRSELIGGKTTGPNKNKTYTDYFPTNVIVVSNASNAGRVHPTQKPVALMEYLIRTYTNEGDTVLDFTMGSGTTGVACANTGRKFIGIELDSGYFEISSKRISEAYAYRPNNQKTGENLDGVSK